MMRRLFHVVTVAVALATARPGFAQDSLRAPTRRRSLAEDLQLFSQVLNQIRVNHPDSLDTHDLLMAAIEGMVAAADPHSYVVPSTRLDSAKEVEMREGHLYPVPIAFRFVAGAPLVAGIAPGSRAVSLDILPGDELVTVNNRAVAAASADELDLALAGPKNSTVTMVLRRRRADGSVARLERVVTRERVDESSAVPAAVMLDAQTGYVRVTTFLGDKVADDLHAALERLEGSGMRRLVLDLRGNGGGRVDEAKRIAGEFLPRGTIVYTASGRKAEITDTGRVQRSFWKSERRYPIVLMVDDGTASASELVAGALQDHDRALIVGRPTFGKSLIMQTFPLTDGSRMALVIGQIRTPCGRVIQRAYHAASRREYYRDAGQTSDTTGRPACRTDRGRTVYGGGGIVPDVMLHETLTPAWLARAGERGLLITWTAGFVDRSGAKLASVDALVGTPLLDGADVAAFRSFAASSDIVVPVDPASTEALTQALIRTIAFSKFGEAGYYKLVALTDPGVKAAAQAFERATELLGAAQPPE